MVWPAWYAATRSIKSAPNLTLASMREALCSLHVALVAVCPISPPVPSPLVTRPVPPCCAVMLSWTWASERYWTSSFLDVQLQVKEVRLKSLSFFL